MPHMRMDRYNPHRATSQSLQKRIVTSGRSGLVKWENFAGQLGLSIMARFTRVWFSAVLISLLIGGYLLSYAPLVKVSGGYSTFVMTGPAPIRRQHVYATY